MSEDERVLVFPSLSTKTIDAGARSGMILGYSQEFVRKSKVPQRLRRELHTNVCSSCGNECFTLVEYKGQDLTFLCERCWSPEDSALYNPFHTAKP